MEMLLCSWCHANNQQGLSQCAVCGAPLNSDDRVSDSGFREAPKLRDMEEFTFSSSTLQIEGKYVPMVEINLHPDDSVYFEQHTIMAKDAQVRLTKKPLNGKRRAHGMPYSVLSASGPGFISFSRDAPGELVVMPIHEHTELDVREHAFLLASHTVDYQFVRIKGLANMVHGGNGMYLDQFTANGASGIVLIHGSGDVVQKTLAPGETIYVEAGKLLYKDSSVSLNTVQLPGINSGFMGNHVYVAELTGGPQGGRVGLHSAYHHSASE